MAMILAPLMLPFLQLVTLATLPQTALYVFGGLLLSPIVVSCLMTLIAAKFLILSPLYLLTLPVTIPVGGLLASGLLALRILKAAFLTFTPLLWPLYWLVGWAKLSMVVSQVIVSDTIMPWFIPARFTFLAAILPKALLA